ncbi:MAG TPA: site-2 protease family protein [Oscillospiraceae bacterium]|nr:site-2 protease family protein [Oscillospiraceae bacterium]
MSILIAVLCFAVMLIFHELGHFLTAKWAGIKVNEFAIGMGPKLFSVKKGETAYSLRLFPIGAFVAMEGEDDGSEIPTERSFMACPVWKRILVTAAGAFMNILLGFILAVILTSGQELIGTPVIAGFSEGASSAEYLKVDDRILSVNGEQVLIDNDIVYSLIRDPDGVVSMEVLRDGEKVELDRVVFEMKDYEGVSSIVLDFSVYGLEPTVWRVVKYSAGWTFALVKLAWHGFGDLLKGTFTISQLSGPVGVTEVISEASSQSLDSLLFIVALVTVNLGVVNLLPLPALDGGRILFMLLEAIRGKPINQKVESAIHSAGFILLILLMIYVTANDIMKLVNGG